MDTQLLDRGKALYQAKNYTEARKIFTKLILSYPDDADAWVWFSAVAKSKEDAIYGLKKAYTLRPNDPKIIKYLSQLGVEQPVIAPSPLDRLEAISNPPESQPIPSMQPSPVSDKKENVQQPVLSSEPLSDMQPTPETVDGKQSTWVDRLTSTRSMVIIIICFLAVIAVGYLFLNPAMTVSATFKENLGNFVREAEKLNSMTEQGVNNNDFRNQLAEVKSAYYIFGGNFPKKYSLANEYFAEAIDIWSATVTIWDREIENTGLCVVENPNEIKSVGGSVEMFCEEAVTVGMTQASMKYMYGRREVNDLLK